MARWILLPDQGRSSARELRESRGFRGRALLPGDVGFDEVCAIYNGVRAPIPSLIVQCSGVADVVEAIRSARTHDLEVAVRCGGHLATGYALCEGGMVLDMRAISQTRVDPNRSTARVGGGALTRDFLAETAIFGRAGITGLSGSVGLAGLTLHKGEGYLTPRYGYAADNVVGVDLVTAAGDVLDVRPGTHPDLFWAVRGAGPNFGVATSMEVNLFTMPTVVWNLSAMYRGREAVRRALPGLVRFLDECSDGSFVYGTASLTATGEHALSVTAGHIGPAADAGHELDLLAHLGSPARAQVTEHGYVELIDHNDSFMESEISGSRHFWDQLESRATPEDFGAAIFDELDLLAARPEQAQGRLFGIATHRHGARRVPGIPAALTRKTGCPVEIFAGWESPADDAMHRAWVLETWQRLKDAGVASDEANTLTAMSSTAHDRVVKAYGAEGYERLQRVKATYDPENFFRHNFNIAPAH